MADVLKNEFYRQATQAEKLKIYIRSIFDSLLSTILTVKGIFSFFIVKSVFVEIPVLLIIFWGYFHAFELVHIVYISAVKDKEA